MKPVRLALIGATGIVGRTTLDVLEEWNVPLSDLRLFSSRSSSGTLMTYRGAEYTVEELKGVPPDIDSAIFATSSALSKEWVPKFRKAGVTVIDHSSYFRMKKDVPLVIPEINGDALKTHSGLISNPNCSVSVILLPLCALHRAFGLRRIIVDTYQSVSGAGRVALDDLEAQKIDEDFPSKVFMRSIAQNVIPQIGEFDNLGVSGEEQKIGDEIRKILEAPKIDVMATTVRVPVRIGHAGSVTAELCEAPTRDELERAMQFAGMIFESDNYRTPLEIAGRQEVFVSRLRQNRGDSHWVQFWVVGDNLRKGAASNAVQILEELYS